MVTTRGGSKPSAGPMQRNRPRKVRKTNNTATPPMILDPSAKGSTAAIANDSAAQSSRESPGLPEQQSDGHESENSGEPNDANRIPDADADADGETINAETYVVEDSEEEDQYGYCTRIAFQAQIDTENLWMNCSMEYMRQALRINNALSKQYKENVAISKKQRNKVEGGVKKMIKDQGDTLVAGIKYIILCGARELEFTQQLGGF